MSSSEIWDDSTSILTSKSERTAKFNQLFLSSSSYSPCSKSIQSLDDLSFRSFYSRCGFDFLRKKSTKNAKKNWRNHMIFVLRFPKKTISSDSVWFVEEDESKHKKIFYKKAKNGWSKLRPKKYSDFTIEIFLASFLLNIDVDFKKRNFKEKNFFPL